MTKIIIATGIVLVILSTNVFAQPKNGSPSVADLQKEITHLQAELTACKNANNATANAQRAEAISSLRAVRSALNVGANFQEFKKYQIESKIKIDNLPDVPENNIIRSISELYNDVVTFSIVRITGLISDRELDAARIRHKNDENLSISRILNDMKANDSSRGLQHDLNQVSGDSISKILIILADREFAGLK